jgi:hypothetical protein
VEFLAVDGIGNGLFSKTYNYNAQSIVLRLGTILRDKSSTQPGHLTALHLSSSPCLSLCLTLALVCSCSCPPLCLLGTSRLAQYWQHLCLMPGTLPKTARNKMDYGAQITHLPLWHCTCCSTSTHTTGPQPQCCHLLRYSLAQHSACATLMLVHPHHPRTTPAPSCPCPSPAHSYTHPLWACITGATLSATAIGLQPTVWLSSLAALILGTLNKQHHSSALVQGCRREQAQGGNTNAHACSSVMHGRA